MIKNYSLLFLLCFFLLGCSLSEDQAEMPDRVTTRILIKGDIEKVYNAYSSEEHLRKFLAPNVMMNEDGYFTTCNELNTNLDEPGHVRNKVTSSNYPEMMQFEVEAVPPYVHYANHVEKLSTVIKFKRTREGTLVEGSTFGFDKWEDSRVTKEMFERINQFTFDQLKNYIEGNPINWSVLDRPHSPEKRYSQFVKDSIWFKTYFLINNQVVRPMVNKAFEKIEAEYQVGLSNLSLFYFAITNFDSVGFTYQGFNHRFPFVKKNFVEEKLDLLVNENLLKKDSNTYEYTRKGIEVAQNLASEISNQEVPILSRVEVGEIVNHFLQIRNESLKPGFKFRFPSMTQKSNALLNRSNAKSLQLAILMDDLVAIRNDASHYRLQNLNPYMETKIELSKGAEEILARVNTELFYANTYANRPTWGFSDSETLNFMDELQSEGLVTWTNDSTIQITERGKVLHSKSSILSEKVFYTPWLSLKPENYQLLKQTISRY